MVLFQPEDLASFSSAVAGPCSVLCSDGDVFLIDRPASPHQPYCRRDIFATERRYKALLSSRAGEDAGWET